MRRFLSNQDGEAIDIPHALLHEAAAGFGSLKRQVESRRFVPEKASI